MMGKKKSRFVSSIDQALRQFDQSHPKSASQQAEIDKYAAVHAARDLADTNTSTQQHSKKDDAIWDGF